MSLEDEWGEARAQARGRDDGGGRKEGDEHPSASTETDWFIKWTTCRTWLDVSGVDVLKWNQIQHRACSEKVRGMT